MHEEKENAKAITIKTGLEGFTVTVGKDGVWLHFEGDNGNKGGFNLGNYANNSGPVVGHAIGSWVNKVHHQYIGNLAPDSD